MMRPAAAIAIAVALASVVSAQSAARAVAASHVGKAVQLMEQGSFADASKEFEQALALDPDNDETRIQYATCLFAEQRDDESRKQFEIERKKLGDKPGLMYYLGVLGQRGGDAPGAIQKLAPLENNPAFPKASYYLGLAYLAAGQQQKGVEFLERAARRNPQDSETHYRLARVYSTAGRADEANREYKLYRDVRDNQRVFEQGGRECAEALRTKPLAEARAACDRIADPNDARRLFVVGQLYCRSQAFADALKPLQRAVQLDPEAFDAWQYLGLALFGLGRYPESLAPLRKAVSLNPQYLDSLMLLATALHAAGDDAGALPVLERARTLNPEDPRVAAALAQVRSAINGKK